VDPANRALNALELASRISVSASTPEPEGDVDAQLKALHDPSHPKVAVFLASGNEIGDRSLGPAVQMVRRREGILLTTDPKRAAHFKTRSMVTDDDLALLLGYPESKADVFGRGGGLVVQARDAEGHVITEAYASLQRLADTVAALNGHVPFAGRLLVLAPAEALARRVALA
jgi:hypothetical protein